ncbi:MAG: carboxymuconolactone decarboxylase family protein [Rubrimonas sp.]
MDREIPEAPRKLIERAPDVWAAYAQLGAACAEAGPLTARERRLVKLALAIGAGSEGATHSHARRARADGVEPAAARQVALLAIGALGFPRAIAAATWIDDVIKEE